MADYNKFFFLHLFLFFCLIEIDDACRGPRDKQKRKIG